MILFKKKFNLGKIFKKGKAMFLAYDQGIEHGPTDFNDSNVDPNYIVDIAKKGDFTGVIFQKGIAEKYYDEIMSSKVPLILKLNGKSSLVKGEPISRQLCTVEEAIGLNATAVGYTIYLGSEHEEEMLKEFSNIQRKARKAGLPVIAWIYPRGKGTIGRSHRELLSYAARVGLEIGADVIKIHWDGKNIEDIAWAVKSAGRAKVVVAGGKKADEKKLIGEIKDAMKVGISGLAIGRNIWQSKDPVRMSERIARTLWGK